MACTCNNVIVRKTLKLAIQIAHFTCKVNTIPRQKCTHPKKLLLAEEAYIPLLGPN